MLLGVLRSLGVRAGRKRADSVSRSFSDATGTWRKETVKVDVAGMGAVNAWFNLEGQQFFWLPSK